MRRTYNVKNGIDVIRKALSSIPILKATRGEKANRDKNYLNICCAFDIETSLLPEEIDGAKESAMYVWQFQFGKDVTIIGRTWNEYLDFINDLNDSISENARLLIFVHNLSYEFQFIRSIQNFDDVFCLHPRKILRARWEKLEYRCSYLLSNQSLERWGKDLGIKHHKLSGEDFDYREVRYSDTPLTVKQIQYAIVDVIALVECLEKQMEMYGDTIRTLPFTRTGYVRRDMKKAVAGLRHTKLMDMKESVEFYRMEREAFRGGDTHANRYYTGEILEGVKSVDISSSYPAALCLEKYPMTPWKTCISREVSHLEGLIAKGYACLFRANFTNITLRDSLWGFPYIASAKCHMCINPLKDNGRVLSADSVSVTITDIDYEILLKEYKWDRMKIQDVYISQYDMLPSEVRNQIWSYFKRKTELKGVDPVKYALVKGDVNSNYGMMAERADRPEIRIEGFAYIQEEADLQERLDKKLLPYSWGVWTTAIARRALHHGLHASGIGALYCDTDSVKYIGECNVSNYNRIKREACTKLYGEAKDKKGVPHYLGVYEDDGEYAEFVTWGAKKYAYTDRDGELHITIAGVGKLSGAQELKEKGGIRALNPVDTVFNIGGGVRAIYNDHPVKIRNVEGHKVIITSNTALVPDTYKMSLTDDYWQLLNVINGNFLWWRCPE